MPSLRNVLEGMLVIAALCAALATALLFKDGGLSQAVHSGLLIGMILAVPGILLVMLALAIFKPRALGAPPEQGTFGDNLHHLSRVQVMELPPTVEPTGDPMLPQPSAQKRLPRPKR